jgi:hypothetical protein
MTEPQALAFAVAFTLAGLALLQRSRHRPRRDPRRSFNASQRAYLAKRALTYDRRNHEWSPQCEHKWWWWRRCPQRERLQGDHFHKAWARGGATSTANGALLCGRHNRMWGAQRKPWLYRWRLERRRVQVR